MEILSEEIAASDRVETDRAGVDGIETDRAAMDRVGEFVRRALPHELARRGIPWRHRVVWDPDAIFVFLVLDRLCVRDELRIGGRHPDDRGGDDAEGWWRPATREWALALTRRLGVRAEMRYRQFHHPDPTERVRVTVWPDAHVSGRFHLTPVPGREPVHLVLEPG